VRVLSDQPKPRQNLLRYREHRIFKAMIVAAAVAVVAALADAAGPAFGASLFVPPLAASLFLVIAVPESAMAQPRALLGGQVLCAAISIAVMHFLPWPELVVAGAFFLSVAAMILTRTVHAPAAATIYFVIVSHASWEMIFVPIAAGSVFVIAMGVMINRLRGEPYPRHWL